MSLKFFFSQSKKKQQMYCNLPVPNNLCTGSSPPVKSPPICLQSFYDCIRIVPESSRAAISFFTSLPSLALIDVWRVRNTMFQGSLQQVK